jgi:hypothetical protein
MSDAERRKADAAGKWNRIDAWSAALLVLIVVVIAIRAAFF